MRERMGRHGKREKKKGSLLATLCFITALAVVLSTGAVSLARYAMQSRKEGVAAAARFYFVSDLLSEDETQAPIQVDPPETGNMVKLSFTVSNHIDDLRWSKKAIKFECAAYDADEKRVASIPPRQDLAADKRDEQTITMEIDKSHFQNGPVTVIAKATSPYEKELKGTFALSGAGASGLLYNVYEENGAVVLELIGDVDDTESVMIQWPQGLVNDPGCTAFTKYGMVTASSRTARLDGPINNRRLALTFLKTSQSYDKSEFSVTVI